MCIRDRDNDRALADIIVLDGESIPDGEEYEIFDPKAVWKRKKIKNFYVKNLRTQIFDKGKCIYECPSIDEIKEYCCLLYTSRCV